MSVYKEDTMFLEMVANRQIQIYDDACDAGIPVKTDNRQLINDLHNLRTFIKTNREYAKVTVSPGWTDGKSGYWKFSYPMIEAIEDGRKIGCIGEITMYRDNARKIEYVNVQLKNPN